MKSDVLNILIRTPISAQKLEDKDIIVKGVNSNSLTIDGEYANNDRQLTIECRLNKEIDRDELARIQASTDFQVLIRGEKVKPSYVGLLL